MQLGEKTWKDASGLTEKIVIVPLGSIEQHGHHLPVLTDSMIASEVLRRAHLELGDAVMVLPTLWLGCSPHHLKFPGTVSVSSDTYIRMIEEIAESLIQGGFRRIMFFNAHAGNMTPAAVALSNVNLRRCDEVPDLWLTFASWFTLAARAIAELPGFTQVKISHACEWETSQIMAIRPELVGSSRPAARFSILVDGEPSRFFPADYSGWPSVDVYRRIDQHSPTGAFGWPELATIEKGEALFDVSARELVAFIREFAKWPDRVVPELGNTA